MKKKGDLIGPGAIRIWTGLNMTCRLFLSTVRRKREDTDIVDVDVEENMFIVLEEDRCDMQLVKSCEWTDTYEMERLSDRSDGDEANDDPYHPERWGIWWRFIDDEAPEER